MDMEIAELKDVSEGIAWFLEAEPDLCERDPPVLGVCSQRR